MADVTGDLGGQPIQLNNAATEATLKQLLAAMTAMARVQAKEKGQGDKYQKAYEKELTKLANATKKQLQLQEKANTQQEKENQLKEQQAKLLEKQKKKQEEYIKSLEDTVQTLNYAAGAIQSAAGAVTNFATSMAGMGNSMTSAAQALSQIPVVGGLVASVFGAVAGAAEKSYKAFQQSASVGANFGGSVSEMINAASGAGMTIDAFSGLVSKSADNLRYLGGTTAEGARKLAELGKEIRTKNFKNLNDDLARLGYSTEEINEGFGQYSMLMAKAGKLQGLSNKELISQTGEYLKNLDAVSKLTGKSKDALQAEEKARQTDAQFRVLQNKVGTAGAGRLNALMNTMGPGMQKAFQAYAATGTAFNDQAKALAVSNPIAAQAMEKFHRQMNESGTVTEEMMYELDEALRSSSKAASQSTTTQSLATFQADKYGEVIVDQMNLAGQDGNLRQARMKQEQELAEKRARAEKLAAEGMDPANMKRFQENIAELSNRFTKLLGENMPKFIAVFEALTNFVEGPAMTAFTLLIDNLGLVVTTFVALKAAAFLFGQKLKIEQMKQLKKGTLADPMITREIGRAGGRGAGKGAGKGAGALGKGLSVGAVGKIGGVVGAVAGLASLAGEWGDISEEQEKGNISEAEATKQKGGAVGGAAGGAAGAWGGAAMGAAIGSVVPVVGTAIGGLLGGAIGYFAGNTLGKKVGEGVGEGVAKLTGATNKATKATDASTAATKDNTETTKEAAEETKKAAEVKETKPDWLDPVSTYKWAKGKMDAAVPGTKATAPITGTGGGISQSTKITVGEAQKGLMQELQAKGITNPEAIANIMAQVQAESGFKPQSENLNYSGKKLFELYGAGNKGGNKVRFKTMAEAEAVASKGPEAVGNVIYGGRMGNKEDEGFKYRGRGLIQLTGKDNYKKFGEMIGVDLVGNPDLANDPAIAQKIAAAYFADKQKKGVDLTNIAAVGKSVGYAGGMIETAKRADLAAGFKTQMATAGGFGTSPATSTPTTTLAQATITPQKPTTETKVPAASVTTSQPTAVAAAGAQETPQTLLASLNNSMTELLRLTKANNRVLERQLSTAQSMSSDLWSNPVV